MDYRLQQDLERFFSIYQSRIAKFVAPLPTTAKAELDEELELLKVSVLHRVAEDC